MRIDRARLELDVGGEIAEVRERAVEQIGPDALALRVAVRALVERLGVLLRVERGERDPSALERDPLRPLGVMRVDRGADGLRGFEVVMLVAREIERGRRSVRIDVGLREVVALVQEPRGMGLGAGVGEAVGEVQPRPMPALAEFLETRDGKTRDRRVDGNFLDVSLQRSFSNCPSAARGEISTLVARTMDVSRRTMLEVKLRSAFSISASKLSPSASDAIIATKTDVSMKITGPKARRSLPWSCHAGSALPSPVSRR